jgi:hypothetical protein
VLEQGADDGEVLLFATASGRWAKSHTLSYDAARWSVEALLLARGWRPAAEGSEVLHRTALCSHRPAQSRTGGSQVETTGFPLRQLPLVAPNPSGSCYGVSLGDWSAAPSGGILMYSPRMSTPPPPGQASFNSCPQAM